MILSSDNRRVSIKMHKLIVIAYLVELVSRLPDVRQPLRPVPQASSGIRVDEVISQLEFQSAGVSLHLRLVPGGLQRQKLPRLFARTGWILRTAKQCDKHQQSARYRQSVIE